jgi:hypothetical protein
MNPKDIKKETQASTPNRKDVLEKLQGLIKGTLTREQVAEWAEPWDDELDMDTDDEAVLTAIGQLSGATFKQSANGPYIYDMNDFREWLEDFQELCAKNSIKK